MQELVVSARTGIYNPSHLRRTSSLLTTRDSNPASSVVRNHIGLLQRYNEIRDVGQQLIGIIAENRGVSLGSIYQDNEFGVGRND